MKSALQSLLLTGLLTLATDSLHAQSMVPAAMNYQGVLTDSNGDPVANAAPENRNIEFRVYSQASGGTPLWGEAQTVTVFKGQFSVVLGNGTAVGGAPSGPASFAAVFANATSADLYFGITPQGSAEFAPRQKLLSSAYALRARVAERVNQASGDSRFDWLYANNLTMQGHTKIDGGNVLEFGTNDPGRARNTSAGLIGYQIHSSGLDIVGAGQESNQRRITLWAEAGTEFKGNINFGARLGQHLNLWGDKFALGIQSGTLYQRSDNNFAWYQGGVHHDDHPNAGSGGTHLATLSSGGFTLNTGVFTGNGSGLTNINPNSLPNNYNYLGINGTNSIEFGRGLPKQGGNGSIYYADNALNLTGGGTAANFSDRKIVLHTQGGLTIHGNTTIYGSIARGAHGVFVGSFGDGHSFGSQDWTTYSRTARNFAWYLGGTFNSNELNPGGGTRVAVLDATGLRLQGEGSVGTAIELGAGVAGKDGSAGIIGYKRFSDGVDIVGAGTTGNNRKVRIWAEGGTTFTGPIVLDGAQRIPFYGLGTDADTLSNNGVQATNNQTVGDVVLSAIGGRICAERFTAMSDARIKNVLALSNGAQDLATLMQVQITDYTKKDDQADQPAIHKKVIAQQVERVFPQAVSQTEGPVPDLMVSAKAKAGFVPLDSKVLARVKQGDVLKVWSSNSQGDGPEVMLIKVTSVASEGIQLEDKLDGNLFIYGHQVDDLRSVDYEAIAMLNVSATQELAKQLKAQAAELAAIKAERDALAKEVAELRTATTRQEKRLASIEAHIEALARPVVKPVSLQAKAGGK